MKLLTTVWDYLRREFETCIILLGIFALSAGISLSINSNDPFWALYAASAFALMMLLSSRFKEKHQWQCPQCGYKEDLPRPRFCPKCGTKMKWIEKPPPLKCPNGHNISPKDEYCPKCGVKIK